MNNFKVLILSIIFLGKAMLTPAFAASFFFSTGGPDGKIGTASRPAGNGHIEIETADDFVLTSQTVIDHATFTGLVPSGASVQQVIVEIYRVFPSDSDVGRTSGAPTFSTLNVPTRNNSPSDVAFDSRDSAISGDLSFSTTTLGSFTALNSVLNGIYPKPNQTTKGDGPVTGEEVTFDVTFTTPFDLPAGHYFFVPQVLLDNGNFFWLSAPKPIVAPGTPFAPDLESWIRDANLDPDWLGIGTDIVGPPPTGGLAPTFNASFSISGTVVESVPTMNEWGMIIFMALAGLGSVYYLRRQRKRET